MITSICKGGWEREFLAEPITPKAGFCEHRRKGDGYWVGHWQCLCNRWHSQSSINICKLNVSTRHSRLDEETVQVHPSDDRTGARTLVCWVPAPNSFYNLVPPQYLKSSNTGIWFCILFKNHSSLSAVSDSCKRYITNLIIGDFLSNSSVLFTQKP